MLFLCVRIMGSPIQHYVIMTRGISITQKQCYYDYYNNIMHVSVILCATLCVTHFLHNNIYLYGGLTLNLMIIRHRAV